MFVLAAGYLPFNDPNLMVMYKKIYKGEFRCPRWMSPELRRFLAKLLDTNPETRITLDGMLRDPWFKKGYKEIKFHEEDYMSGSGIGFGPKDERIINLNAFDIICLSSGLNLSGLFGDAGEGDRLVTWESPEKVLEMAEEAAAAVDMAVQWKKECGVELEGLNGQFGFEVEVYRLTAELTLVEVRKKGSDAVKFRSVWEEKLKPFLLGGATTSYNNEEQNQQQHQSESQQVAGD